MRRRAVVSVFLLLVLVFFSPSNTIPAERISICKLMENKDRYDGKEVEVVGWVVMARQRVSRAGNPYITLTIKDEECAVRVFIWEHHPIKRGDKVRVGGKFAKVKRVGPYTFFDEIEAYEIKVIK